MKKEKMLLFEKPKSVVRTVFGEIHAYMSNNLYATQRFEG